MRSLYGLYRRLEGAAGLDAVEERRIFFPLTGTKQDVKFLL
jgi:hypothetical protein